MASASDLLFPAQYRRRALALLILRPERSLHVREIARLTSSAPGTMARELARLHGAGLLEKRKVGNQVSFSANTEHPVFPELSGLLRKTVGVADILTDALEPLASQIDIAFVFGSMARGTEHAQSDVDLMVIGGVAFADVVAALSTAQDQLRREINPKVFSTEEWLARQAEGSTFVQGVLGRPKLFLIGAQDDLDALIRAGEPEEDRRT